MIRFERGRTCLWLPPEGGCQLRPPPAIVFLHGIGERGAGGEELQLVRRWGLPKLRHQSPCLAPTAAFPFLVVAPQCPANARWCDNNVLEALDALAGEIAGSGEAGPQHLVVAGFDMGGVGAFCLAMHAPQRFRALVSVCGKCEQPERLDELAHLPLWVAWAEDDEIGYLTEGSRQVVERTRGRGAVVSRPYRLGARPGAGAHVRTADAAFAEPDLYRWLMGVLTGETPPA